MRGLAVVLCLGMTSVISPAWSLEKDSANARAEVTVPRTVDDVRRVVDKHKGAFYSIFTRAARERPGLRGEIILSFTIEPDGRVSKCDVASSTLYHPELERKIVDRFSAIDFGAKGAKPYRNSSYPMTFVSI